MDLLRAIFNMRFVIINLKTKIHHGIKTKSVKTKIYVDCELKCWMRWTRIKMEVIQSVANGSLEIFFVCVLFHLTLEQFFFFPLACWSENEYRWTEKAVMWRVGGLFCQQKTILTVYILIWKAVAYSTTSAINTNF